MSAPATTEAKLAVIPHAMRKALAWVVLGLSGLCFSGCQSPVFFVRGSEPKIIDYGTYDCRVGLPVTSSNSPTGYTLPLGPERHFFEVDEFIATRGTIFGFRYFLPPQFTNDLRVVYSFPVIQNPLTQKNFTGVEAKPAVVGKNGVGRVLYIFAEEYEIQPGDWNLSVYSGERLLLEKRFRILRKSKARA